MAQSQIIDILTSWQRKRFSEKEITFNEAVASLKTDDPLVVAEPGVSSSRWSLNLTDQKKIATLVHTGIWAWDSDLETGNFVPEGETAPRGVPESRIQKLPSFRCEITYAFDTTTDVSFWKNLRILEDHVQSQPMFNKGNRPRRVWQNGRDPTAMEKFVMSARIFSKRIGRKDEGDSKLKYKVNPWIEDAVATFPELNQVPNPNRPSYWELVGQSMRLLDDMNKPVFEKNDIVRVRFKVYFVVGAESWYPELVPVELTRVGKLPPELVSRNMNALVDEEDFEPGETISFIETPVRENKRKAAFEDQDMEDTSSFAKKRAGTLALQADGMDEAETSEQTSSKNKHLRSAKGKENKVVKA